jgi:hypothetical protein
MARKKKLDWKQIALWGGGGLFILWLLKGSADAAAPKKKLVKFVEGEPYLGRFQYNDAGTQCWDTRKNQLAAPVECEYQKVMPVTDTEFWSRT